MKIIDSHCHIHDKDFPIPQSEVFENMQNAKFRKQSALAKILKTQNLQSISQSKILIKLSFSQQLAFIRMKQKNMIQKS